jgi:hypothetical protein
MPYIIDFTLQIIKNIPPNRKNLRLILWAGDGEYEGVSDVKRLPNYDMYFCLGLRGSNVSKNIEDLSGSQTLCIIDAGNPEHMSKFHKEFEGAFAHIDADYRGNTPSLPLVSYAILLGSGGSAYNTEGLNGIRMPEEDLLNILEIFAPILSPNLKRRRRWYSGILSLAEFNQISPEEAWASPDLKHPFCASVVEDQKSFAKWQVIRNKLWPSCENSLEEQWASLPICVLCWVFVNPRDIRYYNRYVGTDEVFSVIDPYMQRFSDYLSQRIEAIFHKIGEQEMHDYSLECMKCTDTFEGISLRQKVLGWLSHEIPTGMSRKVGYFNDTRLAENPVVFGMWYRQKSTIQCVKDSEI